MEKNLNASESSDELVVPFMVAEFGTLSDRILQIEKTRKDRVNFYILILSAAITGISFIAGSKIDPTISTAIMPVILLIVFLLGMAILKENLLLASQAVFMYRRAGRIRCWFRDKNTDITRYLPWSAGDDTPTFLAEPEHSTFAGKDSILWFGNSVIGATFIMVFLSSYELVLPMISLVIAATTFFVIWASQNIYIGYQAEKYERIGKKKGRIHFPREGYDKTVDNTPSGKLKKIVRWAFGLTPRAKKQKS